MKSIPVYNGIDFKIKKNEKHPVLGKSTTPKRTLALSRKINMKIENMSKSKSKLPSKVNINLKSPLKSPIKSPSKSLYKSPSISPLQSPPKSPKQSPSKYLNTSPNISPSKSVKQSPSKTPLQSPKQSPLKESTPELPEMFAKKEPHNTSTMTKNSPVTTEVSPISSSPRHEIEAALGMIAKEGEASPINELDVGDLRKLLTDIRSSPTNGESSVSKGGQRYDYTEIIEQANAALRNSGRGKRSNKATPTTSPNLGSPLEEMATPLELYLPSPPSSEEASGNFNTSSNTSPTKPSPTHISKQSANTSPKQLTSLPQIKRATPPSTLNLQNVEDSSCHIELVSQKQVQGDLLTGQQPRSGNVSDVQNENEDVMLITFD